MYQEVNLTGKKLSSKNLTGVIGLAGGTKDYNLLTNKPSINNVELSGNKTTSELGINIPTKTSDLVNDSDFVSDSDLAAVATSGSYNDLINLPTIPTKTSELTNDSAFPSALYISVANNNSRTLNYASRCLLFSSHSSSVTLKGIYMRIGTAILPIIDASGLTITATDSTLTIANASGYTANLFLIRNI